jgi:hypothetical protein
MFFPGKYGVSVLLHATERLRDFREIRAECPLSIVEGITAIQILSARNEEGGVARGIDRGVMNGNLSKWDNAQGKDKTVLVPTFEILLPCSAISEVQL